MSSTTSSEPHGKIGADEDAVAALFDGALGPAAGLNDPSELGPEHILRRVSPIEIRSMATLYRYLSPGELLDRVPGHAVFREYWADARSDSFDPPARIAALRGTKLH